MPIITCISLHQPWASLIFIGVKHHETRHWQYPKHLDGQRIGIHAAQAMQHNPGPELQRALTKAYGENWRGVLPRGALVGTARLSGCIPTEVGTPEGPLDQLAGDWTPGRFAWRLTEVEPLEHPIRMPGRQRWFSAEIPG